MRAELSSLHSWLEAQFPPQLGDTRGWSFAYPKGVYEDTTDGVAIETLVAEAGFRSGRTILAEVGVQNHAQVNERAPARRPPMEYRLYGMSSISSVASGARGTIQRKNND